ncbi:hypothetical protein [Arthrobacter sp. VKM Ac-2550]|uniref:hypothetical protein n=1 Tax=Crystallibacter permensis TaxID=1938888 RepID=UPI0022265462|nr:hypothetical protein [Arthrobacter sp. VKM Ac-2550]MCW2132399.1 hypothetical protein [Arthrobacter sp. VKM Ac-2550]
MKNYSARGRRRAGPTVSSHGVTSLVRGRRRAKDQAPSAVSFRSVGALTGLAVVATVAAAAALPLDQSGSQEAHAGRPQLQTSGKTWPIFAPSNEAEPTFSRPTTDSTAAAQQDTKVTPSAATQPTPGGDATELPAPLTTKFATDPTGEAAAPLTGAVEKATGAAKEKVAGATSAATQAAGKDTAAATEAAEKTTATATDAAKPTASPTADAAKPTASPTADAAVPTSPATSPPAKQSARAVPEDAEPTRSGVRSNSAAPVEPAPTTEAAEPEERPAPETSPAADKPTRDAEKKKHRQDSDRTVDDAEWLWILLGEDESR